MVLPHVGSRLREAGFLNDRIAYFARMAVIRRLHGSFESGSLERGVGNDSNEQARIAW